MYSFHSLRTRVDQEEVALFRARTRNIKLVRFRSGSVLWHILRTVLHLAARTYILAGTRSRLRCLRRLFCTFRQSTARTWHSAFLRLARQDTLSRAIGFARAAQNQTDNRGMPRCRHRPTCAFLLDRPNMLGVVCLQNDQVDILGSRPSWNRAAPSRTGRPRMIQS